MKAIVEQALRCLLFTVLIYVIKTFELLEKPDVKFPAEGFLKEEGCITFTTEASFVKKKRKS